MRNPPMIGNEISGLCRTGELPADRTAHELVSILDESSGTLRTNLKIAPGP
jgi:hypothetical protein